MLCYSVTQPIQISNCGQQVEGRDSAVLLCSSETPSGVLCPALEPSAQERQEPTRVGPEEGHSNDQRAGTPLLEGKAERAGAVQPGEKRLQGELTAAFRYSKKAYKKDGDKPFSRACCDRSRGNGFKLKNSRFRLHIRKKFFTLWVVRQWNRLPKEVVAAPSLEITQNHRITEW